MKATNHLLGDDVVVWVITILAAIIISVEVLI